MNNIILKLKESASYLGNGIIKVDSILNHQVDTNFIDSVAEEFLLFLKSRKIQDVTKIVTIEASGISVAYSLASLLKVPFIYARKGEPITMRDNIVSVIVKSRTKGTTSKISLSNEFLSSADKVVIVDDFLGSGGALNAITSLIKNTGAEILAACFVIEKTYELGRESSQELGFPIFSLAKAKIDGEMLTFY